MGVGAAGTATAAGKAAAHPGNDPQAVFDGSPLLWKLLKRPVMVDLRNIYTPADTAKAGFSHSSIGRPSLPAAAV